MDTSRSVRFALVVCSLCVLVACMNQRSGPEWPTPDPDRRTRTGRTSPPGIPPLPPRGEVIVRPCVAADTNRQGPQEREWKRTEAEIEQPLRDILAEGATASEALARLDNDVLKPHGWTLTRYLVRVLRELQARSIREASVEIANEEYAMRSLDDAHWDGQNAWEVVQTARSETVQVFAWLETVRTTDNPRAQQAQGTAERLLYATRLPDLTTAPLTDDSRCKRPTDSSPRTPAELTAHAN